MLLQDDKPTESMFANGRGEAARPGRQLTRDALLRVSRRLDWRFLLPNPDLGQVAYVGPAQEMLVDSLRLFSTSLTVFATGGRGHSPQFDIVVASNPTSSTIRPMIEMLRPDGWLYIEIHNPLAQPGLRWSFQQARSVRDHTRALRQPGLDQVKTHWHWPDFETCTKIIPLDDLAALSHVLVQRRPTVGKLLQSSLGRWMLERGLLALTIPHFSLVAHRSASGGQPERFSMSKRRGL